MFSNEEVTVVAAVAVEEEVPLEDEVDLVEEGAVQEEARTLSSSLTDIKVFSSQRARRVCSSPRTWSPESQSMARSVSLSKEVLREPRSSTVFGILSVRSWLLVFLVVWTTFTSHQERRFFTLVLRAEPVSVMLLTSSALRVSSTPSSSPFDRGVT